MLPPPLHANLHLIYLLFGFDTRGALTILNKDDSYPSTNLTISTIIIGVGEHCHYQTINYWYLKVTK